MKSRFLFKIALLSSLVGPLGGATEESPFLKVFSQTLSATKPEYDANKAWHPATLASQTTIKDENKIPLNKVPTVIIVPGIFAEMIESVAFTEAFNSSSAYKREIKQLTQGIEVPKTAVFDFESLKTVSKPITDVFEFGEIEKNGERVANLILLKTELFSLDSLGRMRELRDRFSSRLTTLFNVIGIPENIIIIGYSRGAAIGLDMITAQADDEAAKWIASVKSFVSLAGVIRGSALADETANLSTPAGKLLREVSLAARDLTPNQEPPQKHILENTQNFSNNAIIIGRLLSAIGQYALHEVDPSNKMRVPSQPEFKKIFQIASDLFKLHEPITEYSTNILKLKVLLKSVEHGVRELRSAVREDWWRRNLLPKEVNYYSIAASFKNRSEISSEDFGYNFPSIDDKSLYGSYEKIIRLVGDSLNDSQVTVSRASFDREKLALLNPNYDPSYRMEHIGVLSTHHWGIALSRVNDTPGVHGLNNIFPRKELLESLVLYAR